MAGSGIYSQADLEAELSSAQPKLRLRNPSMEAEFRADFQQLVPYARRNIFLILFSAFALLPIVSPFMLEPPEEMLPLFRLLEHYTTAVLGLALLAVTVAALRPWADVMTSTAMLATALVLELVTDITRGSGYPLPSALADTAIVLMLILCRIPFWRLVCAALMALSGMILIKILLGGRSLEVRFEIYGAIIFTAVGMLGAYRYEISARSAWLRRQLLLVVSTQDELTGLLNRRGFDRGFARTLGAASREHASLTVLLLDLDCFKLLNDRYGHAYGDECLRQVSKLLSATTRRSLDLCGRYGGEEFVLVWYDAPLAHAQRMAAELIAAVESAGIEHLASTVKQVLTISAGAIHLNPDANASAEALLKMADERLYAAKSQGRNQLVFN